LLTGTQTITTVASQSNYALNANYLRMYLSDEQGKFYIKYNDGTNDTFIYNDSYHSIIHGNNTTAVTVPFSFAVWDRTPASQITGTETSAGFLTNQYNIFGYSGGETTLTDSTAPFASVSAGDTVHNASSGGMANGYVVSVTSSSAVVCALFGDMDGLYFKSGDSYIINPQSRFELELNPPPSTSAHTITVYYTKKPDPVYSAYRSYPIPSGYSAALIHYAAWLFKYRDKEANTGDALYKYWVEAVKGLGRSIGNAKQRPGYTVSFIKNADKSWTYK
jgi:hypothetical protein